jgi:hypothetical protein
MFNGSQIDQHGRKGVEDEDTYICDDNWSF